MYARNNELLKSNGPTLRTNVDKNLIIRSYLPLKTYGRKSLLSFNLFRLSSSYS